MFSSPISISWQECLKIKMCKNAHFGKYAQKRANNEREKKHNNWQNGKTTKKETLQPTNGPLWKSVWKDAARCIQSDCKCWPPRLITVSIPGCQAMIPGLLSAENGPTSVLMTCTMAVVACWVRASPDSRCCCGTRAPCHLGRTKPRPATSSSTGWATRGH